MTNKSIIHRLYQQKKIDCPAWLPDNLCYLTVMGSRAYGCENENSDWDYYGMAIIPRNCIFPHEYGLLIGLDHIPNFNQWTCQNFLDTDSGKDLSFTVYGIVRYAKLLMDGNPNIIESLFTRRENVIFSSPIGEKFRINRKMFLSKQNFINTRNYAFSQLKKLKRKPEGNRLEDYEKFGYSTKFAAHTVRLLDNCDQIITTQDIDLHRNKEMVKSIRRGEWTLDQITNYAHEKEIILEKALAESDLQNKVNVDDVRELIMQCIQHSYQNVKFIQPDEYKTALIKIQGVIDKINLL